MKNPKRLFGRFIIEGRRWADILQGTLLPPTCLVCGAEGFAGRDLCAGCADDLPRIMHACYRCGEPLASPTVSACGRCQRQLPPYDRILAPLRYQTPVDKLIIGLKFNGKLALARLLGELLADAVENRADLVRPECLIPVPLHPARLRERGFNQALELARPLARRLQIPLLHNRMRRIRYTERQTGLRYKVRQGNVKGAFALREPFAAKHVALIDDVVTSASTVTEMAWVLREAGIETIQVWACARATRDD